MATSADGGHRIDAGDARGVAHMASEHIAGVLRDAIAKAGQATLALSGGNTPREAYALLSRERGIDWRRTRIFWVDERAVPPTDDRSNYGWAKQILLDPALIPPGRVHRMRAEDPDRASAALEYEALIRAHVSADADGVPSFDVAVMGIGDDGHTASLFPDEPTVTIADRLVAEVPACGGHEARLTITRVMIQHARKLFFLVVGPTKRPALERIWADKGDDLRTPARLARSCLGDVEWILDRAAAGG
jgi:6-phosphogluconolactonase